MNKICTQISEAILDGAVVSTANLVKEALSGDVSPKEILENGLLAGMSEVGDLFKEGEMFVPEVLVSAKAMQAGMEIVRPLLVGDGNHHEGKKILTVTVEGDLHDIGVKLVGMMLEGAGFEVFYMGVDKPASEIIEKIKKYKPKILGMSAMLTTTMVKMKEVIDLAKEEGLLDDLVIMIGGAPTSPAFASKIGAIYAANASEAVETAKQFI